VVVGVRVTTTAIVVNSQSLFRQPRGQVAIWCLGRARNLKQAARIRCPPNRSMARRGEWATGALLASIDSAVEQEDLHSRHRQFTMDRGQHGFVMPVRGKMYLRVHGQRANPFLSDAYASVQRKSRSLPRLMFKRTAD
jgi:hypothetical protein